MNIGIIGSGEMGICLAAKIVKAGHRVSLANSRRPDTLKNLSEEIGFNAVGVSEVVENKDIIFVSVPTKNVPDLTPVFKKLTKDTVVIDTMNYYPVLRDGFIARLDHSGIDSIWVQEVLDFPIVKAFNSILATSLGEFGRPKGDKSRIAIPVSSDHVKDKNMVFSLIDELGFDPFDMGRLTRSWRQQPGSPVYCRDFNLTELVRKVNSMDSDWPQIRDEAVAKRRADEALMKEDYQTYLQDLKLN